MRIMPFPDKNGKYRQMRAIPNRLSAIMRLRLIDRQPFQTVHPLMMLADT
jgi:hypothetical protein